MRQVQEKLSKDIVSKLSDATAHLIELPSLVTIP